MIFLDTEQLISDDETEIVNKINKRLITHVFHDIDGTHSLIRNWQPVMSRVLYYVIENGLKEGYDSEDNVKKLIKLCDTKKLPETDNFCIESAGLSALTQMEWAIRRAIQGNKIDELKLSLKDKTINSHIVECILNGEELFDKFDEPQILNNYLKIHTPRLFRLYEKVLNGFCRNKNLEQAKQNPDKFLVSGSKKFIRMLYENGAKNYFVTGAVVDTNALKPMGMYEEVLALGFDVGKGKEIEAICGSTWDEKIPKEEVMKRICRNNNIDPKNVLIVGDGRSEISAGAGMGAVCISRLPYGALRQRELHKKLGTDIIVENFSGFLFKRLWILE